MTDMAAYPAPGEVPVLDWLDKALIDVDPLYQRPLDMARVEAIVKEFAWRSFGALVVVAQADGTYHATDGQHRLEAAKLHPQVTHVPAVIVKAPDVSAEAGIFVSINRNRKNVSALELFFADLAANSQKAIDVLKATQRAGIRVPKYPGNFRPNDTIAVAALQALVDGYVDTKVDEFLKVVVAGRFRPITAGQIKAVEHLLTNSEFAPQIHADDLATLLASVGTSLDKDARRFEATHGGPFWKALAATWFQKCKKRRQPAKAPEAQIATATAVAAPRPSPAPTANRLASTSFRTIIPHAPLATERVVTSAVMGDPDPGRSALAQRRQA